METGGRGRRGEEEGEKEGEESRRNGKRGREEEWEEEGRDSLIAHLENTKTQRKPDTHQIAGHKFFFEISNVSLFTFKLEQ